MKDCIDACDNAHRACTEAAIHAMQQGGDVATWEGVQLLLDTADLTETAANFLLRSSRMYQNVIRVTAEIADRCADWCEAYAKGDIRMKECADTCRRAATHCRKIL